MMSSTYLASSRSLWPKLSNTLQTNSLDSSNEYMSKASHSDFESDSSSICHSPCWDNNGKNKNKVDKREKKQRDKEMEKVREKGRHSKSKQGETENLAARPRKLSKRPPNVKAQSADTILGKKIDASHSSPVLLNDRNAAKSSSEAAGTRRNNILGLRSRMADNSSVDTAPMHTPGSQPDAEFIGGLKLRREEEENVQQAIRRAKGRDHSDGRTLSLHQLGILGGHNHPITASMERFSLYDESEIYSSQNQSQLNPNFVNVISPSKSSIYSDDYFSMSKCSSMIGNPPSSQYSWGNESTDDKYRNYPYERNTRSIYSSQSHSPSSQTFGVKSPILRDRSLAADSIPNEINLGSETSVSEPYKINSAFEESTSLKPTLSITPPSAPILNTPRNATKQPFPMANITSEEDKRILLETRTGIARNKTSSTPGFNDIPRATSSSFSQSLNQKSPNAMYNDVDQFYNLGSTDHHPATYQGTRNQSDINAAQSVMNTAQELQRSLDSNETAYQFNPCSHTASTDSSEEYYTQDDLSSITTPSESRPHSLRGSSLYEVQNETWPAQVAVRLGPLAENENKYTDNQAANLKLGSQNEISNIKLSATSRIERTPHVATTRPTELTTPGIIKDEVEQSHLSQDLYKSNHTIETYQTQEPVQGLIKRQTKPNNLKRPLNPKTKYEVSKCSQYLQEARSRIGSAVSSPRSSSLRSDSPHSSSDPFAKMFVVCCSCKYFHDMPSKLYACMTQPDNVVREESLGVSGVVTTSVKCPWCGHGMSTSCCAGYAAVVYMKERLH